MVYQFHALKHTAAVLPNIWTTCEHTHNLLLKFWLSEVLIICNFVKYFKFTVIFFEYLMNFSFLGFCLDCTIEDCLSLMFLVTGFCWIPKHGSLQLCIEFWLLKLLSSLVSKARDNLVFLQRWFDKFPQYKGRDLFITGESYAGTYISWVQSPMTL